MELGKRAAITVSMVVAGLLLAPEAAARCQARAFCPLPRIERLDTAALAGLEAMAPGVADLLAADADAFAREQGTGRDLWIASIPIAARPEEIWSVLTDFRSWPEFMPGVTSSSVADASVTGASVTGGTGAELAVHQGFARFGLTLDYTSHTRLDRGAWRLEQVLDESTHHDVVGAHSVWNLVPVPDSDITLAVLRFYFDPGIPLPRFVAHRFVRNSLLDTLDSLSREVHRRETRFAMAEDVAEGFRP